MDFIILTCKIHIFLSNLSLYIHKKICFLQMVEELLRPIKKFDGTTNHAASRIRKAPVSGGCRIEGYVRAKKVRVYNVLISSSNGLLLVIICFFFCFFRFLVNSLSQLFQDLIHSMLLE